MFISTEYVLSCTNVSIINISYVTDMFILNKDMHICIQHESLHKFLFQLPKLLRLRNQLDIMVF